MISVQVQGVSKRYDIYERPVDRLKEILWRNKRCFHREYWALKNINLQIKHGTTTALLGPNGSGKSTLLQIVAGVVQPTTGKVTVRGRLTAILELGSGFQPEYTGRENVLLSGMILGVSKEEMEARMDEIAEFAEIGEFFDQPVKTYSSGMAVRLAFAAAINVDPDVLLVDEALAVGDSRFQQKCVKKIENLQGRGKTILFVSHDCSAVRRFCEQAILLNNGEILGFGHANDIVNWYEELMDNGSIIVPKVFTAPATLM